MRRSLFIAVGIALLAIQPAGAAAPAKMAYQGVLKNASGTIVPDGTYQVTIKLHDAATAGAVVWTGAQQDVVVSRGLFTATLSGGTPDFATVGFDRALFLTIAIGVGSDLLPRIELTPAPYTMVARAVTADGVTGTAIADGTITNADISPSAAIAGSKIAPSFSGVVSASSFSGGTVTASQTCLPFCLTIDLLKVVLSQIGGSNIVFRVNSNGDVFADGTFSPGGADYADMMPVSGGPTSVAPGDVLAIDPASPRSVIKATQSRSTLVAGIYSTRPGIAGSEEEWEESSQGPALDGFRSTVNEGRATSSLVPVALTGIVPCNVSAENGPIRPGDLLVTSSIPGHAMRDDNPKPGTVLGKALEPLKSGTGTVRVLVALH